MSRRFQFSLRLIFALTAIVAGGCAIWINLPIAVRVAIGAARGHSAALPPQEKAAI